MATPSVPFAITIMTHPDIRAARERGGASAIFSLDLSRLLWVDAAAARLFEVGIVGTQRAEAIAPNAAIRQVRASRRMLQASGTGHALLPRRGIGRGQPLRATLRIIEMSADEGRVVFVEIADAGSPFADDRALLAEAGPQTWLFDTEGAVLPLSAEADPEDFSETVEVAVADFAASGKRLDAVANGTGTLVFGRVAGDRVIVARTADETGTIDEDTRRLPAEPTVDGIDGGSFHESEPEMSASPDTEDADRGRALHAMEGGPNDLSQTDAEPQKRSLGALVERWHVRHLGSPMGPDDRADDTRDPSDADGLPASVTSERSTGERSAPLRSRWGDPVEIDATSSAASARSSAELASEDAEADATLDASSDGHANEEAIEASKPEIATDEAASGTLGNVSAGNDDGPRIGENARSSSGVQALGFLAPEAAASDGGRKRTLVDGQAETSVDGQMPDEDGRQGGDRLEQAESIRNRPEEAPVDSTGRTGEASQSGVFRDEHATAGHPDGTSPGGRIPEAHRSAPLLDAETGSPPADGASFAPDFSRSAARFVWRIDAEGRFRSVSPELAAAVGPASADLVDRSFAEIAAALRIDPHGEVAGLLLRRDTWSGRTLLWPVENTAKRVPVDLAALPVYSRDRTFDGFRGFGVVRLGDAVDAPAGDDPISHASAGGETQAGANLFSPQNGGPDGERDAFASSAEPEDAARSAEGDGPVAGLSAAEAIEIFGLVSDEAEPHFGRRAPSERPSAAASDAVPERSERPQEQPAAQVIRLEERRGRRETHLSKDEQAAFRAIGATLGDEDRNRSGPAGRTQTDAGPPQSANEATDARDGRPDNGAGLLQDDLEAAIRAAGRRGEIVEEESSSSKVSGTGALQPANSERHDGKGESAAPTPGVATVVRHDALSDGDIARKDAPKGAAVGGEDAQSDAATPTQAEETGVSTAKTADKGHAERAVAPERPVFAFGARALGAFGYGLAALSGIRGAARKVGSAGHLATSSGAREAFDPKPQEADEGNSGEFDRDDEGSSWFEGDDGSKDRASLRPTEEGDPSPDFEDAHETDRDGADLSPAELALRHAAELIVPAGGSNDDGTEEMLSASEAPSIFAQDEAGLSHDDDADQPRLDNADTESGSAPRSPDDRAASAGVVGKALSDHEDKTCDPDSTIAGETAAHASLVDPAGETADAGTDADGATEDGPEEAPLLSELDRIYGALPLPVLVQLRETLIYGNGEFSRLTGYLNVTALNEAGGLARLFAEVAGDDAVPDDGAMAVSRATGGTVSVRTHMQRATINERSCLVMSFFTMPEGVDRLPVPDDASATDGPFDGEGDTVAILGADSAPIDGDETAMLRQTVEELYAVLAAATDGVVLLGTDGTIRRMNEPAHSLFGIARDDAAGRPFVTLFAHESQKAAGEYLESLRTGPGPVPSGDGREVIGRAAEGGFVPLQLNLGRLPGTAGWCAVVRDISRRKRIEEELTNARSTAEAASFHKSQFLANISHELRTPLNAIIGFADVIATECFGPIGNERYLEYLDDIKRSGHHVLDLVNDLLDISKIEAGKLDLQFEAVLLNEVVAEIVALMQPQANRERVLVRSNLPTSVPPVVADRRSLRQIALNLVSNAVRFTPAGGQIIVSTRLAADGAVTLRFRDTGIGMSEDEIAVAMMPFQQVGPGPRRRGEGTGLGLPLTKALAEANRAEFALSSTPGEGTMVEILFPAQRVLAD